MVVDKLLFLLLLSVINRVASLTASEIQVILDGHNDLRAFEEAKDMIELQWDANLATVAQNWANTHPNVNPGPFAGHNTGAGADYVAVGGAGSCVGENWYSAQPHDAAYKWVNFEWPIAWGGSGCSERQDYYGLQNSAGDTCSSSNPGSQTGHYTAVVWAKTQYVGCGYHPDHGTTCNYYPCGNFNNQDPFVEGLPRCDSCPPGNPTCSVNQLCYSGPPTVITSAPTIAPTPPTTLSPTSSCIQANQHGDGCGICTNDAADTANVDSFACRGRTFDTNGNPDGGFRCPSGRIWTCNEGCWGSASAILNVVGDGTCNNYFAAYGVDMNCGRFVCDGGDCGTSCDTAAFVGPAKVTNGNLTLLPESRGNPIYITLESSARQYNAVVAYLSCAIFAFISYFA